MGGIPECCGDAYLSKLTDPAVVVVESPARLRKFANAVVSTVAQLPHRKSSVTRNSMGAAAALASTPSCAHKRMIFKSHDGIKQKLGLTKRVNQSRAMYEI